MSMPQPMNFEITIVGLERPFRNGERAYLVCQGVKIHSGLAKLINGIRNNRTRCCTESITSTGNVHTYIVATRGFTIKQFVEIAEAFASGNPTLGDELIDRLVVVEFWEFNKYPGNI